jgi:hypothetical protein
MHVGNWGASLAPQAEVQKRKLRFSQCWFGLMAVAVGCGRYEPPLAPERLSPAAVQLSEANVTSGGVTLTFLAPTTDRRGKKLSGLEGFLIYRKELEKASDALNPRVPFTVVQRVEDTSLETLGRKKEEAVRAGIPVRRVSLSGEERRVTVTDASATEGHTYLYKVVPYSLEGVDGEHDSLIRVVVSGSSGSTVTIIPAADDEAMESMSLDDIAGGLNEVGLR